MRYDQRTLREEREYGVYWYAWLWRVLRPVTVFLCAVLIVVGLVTTGWNKVYETFLMPVDPDNTQTVRFTIESGDSISEIGENLEKAQLLRNRTVFRYLVQFLGRDGQDQLRHVRPLALHGRERHHRASCPPAARTPSAPSPSSPAGRWRTSPITSMRKAPSRAARSF